MSRSKEIQEFKVGFIMVNPKTKDTFVKVGRERFPKLNKAKSWCSNHWGTEKHQGMLIIHADGTKEDYVSESR